MKSTILLQLLLLLLLPACGTVPAGETVPPPEKAVIRPLEAAAPEVSPATVYASIEALGPHSLTVQVGDARFLLSGDALPPPSWQVGDLVVLSYTGELGDAMQVQSITRKDADNTAGD